MAGIQLGIAAAEGHPIDACVQDLLHKHCIDIGTIVLMAARRASARGVMPGLPCTVGCKPCVGRLGA